jgi:hypothetical protein
MKNSITRITLFSMLFASIVCGLFVFLPWLTTGEAVQQLADGPTPWPPPPNYILATAS